MKIITTLLERYRNLVAPDVAVKAAFCALVKEKIKTEILPAEVRVARGTLFISGSSALRSEISLRKKDFLEEIEKRTGKKLTDIR